MKKYVLLSLLFLLTNLAYSQSYKNWDEHNVDYFYEKIDLDYGTLDEDGDEIDHIYVRTEIEAGVYEVEISDETGDLFLIEGTDYYVEFTGYYGYASYDDGILEVNSYGGGTFYEEDSY